MDLYVHTHPRLKQAHVFDGDAVEEALLEFEGAALKFSHDFIQDAKQRENYDKNTKRVKDEVKRQLKLGKVTPKSAAEFCYTMRDYLLVETRKRTSIQGRAVVEWKKKASPELEQLLNDKSLSKFGKGFAELSLNQRDIVYYMIVESSARPSVFFNVLNKVLMTVGKVFIVVTIAYAAYEIMNADDKLKETFRQGVTIGSGVFGAWLGSVLAGSLCGPGAPICVVGIMAATGVAAGTLGAVAVNAMDEELDEFSRYWLY